MELIHFNELYNLNKKLLYKHYFYNYLHDFLFRYSIIILSLFILIIFILILLFYLKKINIYYIFYTIIFFVLCIFYIYTNRANKCFLLSSKIINNNLKPIETKSYLLDKPFKEFYVYSSHNSYIPCNQNLDIASLDSIKNVLLMGARCIELDIHEKNNEPVVAHGLSGLLTTTYFSLEDCIDVINKYGFLTSDPLVLFIEVKVTNEYVLKKISNIIKSNFRNRLLSNEYKMSNKYKKLFFDEPIKNLLDKIIIVSSSISSINKHLEDILDDNTYNDILNNNSDTIITTNYMQRIYSKASICLQFSCNYDPIIHWKNKANFVSLNFQTFDDALIKNHTMFKNYSLVHFSEISFD
jgi:hypothetical protein